MTAEKVISLIHNAAPVNLDNLEVDENGRKLLLAHNPSGTAFFWADGLFVISRSPDSAGFVHYYLRSFVDNEFTTERTSCSPIEPSQEKAISPTPGFHLQLFWRPKDAEHGVELLSVQSDIYTGEIFLMESATHS